MKRQKRLDHYLLSPCSRTSGQNTSSFFILLQSSNSSTPAFFLRRAGLGPLGSRRARPSRSPPSSNSTPAFFLRLKPRLGDFLLSHTLRSHAAADAPQFGEAAPDGEREFGYKPSFSFTGGGLAAAGTKSGVGALLSGMQMTTRSVLPLWGRASLRFNWGLRVPAELLADGVGGRSKGARAPVSKMPLLRHLRRRRRLLLPVLPSAP
ncbi:unnamed protein product [Urochloa humidicola]